MRATTLWLVAMLLCGCGGGLQPPLFAAGAGRVAPPPNRPQSSSAESVVYSFPGGKDGSVPEAALLAVGGTLYGVTVTGGTGSCGVVPGCGTAFELRPSGKARVLHSFAGGSDGEAPQASFIESDGKLYSTTVLGGDPECKVYQDVKGCGTVFELSRSGVEHVLHRFSGGAKGAAPQAPLTVYGDEFFGEAQAGGTGTCRYAKGCGVIFKMSRSGHVHVVYSFKGDPDGAAPQGGLLLLNGNFYGTTGGGGSYACRFSNGCGTVFKITPSGREMVLHVFRRAYDGALPQGGLVLLNSKLYGATFSGGRSDCALSGSGFGCGTIFEVSLSGRERVLHTFTGSDGAYPNQLLVVGRKLYGTTGGWAQYSCGSVFELTPSGRLTTLYAFKGGSDGCGPNGALVDVGGTLYGTTTEGGAYNEGTVFSVTL